MQTLVWVLGVALGVQLAILAWNIGYWKLRRPPQSAGRVSVSVLIPARNERENLPRLLEALDRQSLRPDETIVCDDDSDDGTDEWLAANAERYGATWFRADPKPEGWVGKNWACHLLGGRAKGDWLLWLDADVCPEPQFIEFLAGVLQQTPATLVTAFPNMRTPSTGAGLLVGMVPFSVFTTLPLKFAERRPNPAFGFANGQVIAFRRPDYERLRPHEQVHGELLEDVALAKLVKRAGEQVHIADASSILRVEMYSGPREAMDGFSKNAVAICGGLRRAVAIALVMLLLYIAPFGLLAAGADGVEFLVAASVVLFGVSVSLVGLPWWYGLLYPVAVLLTEFVIIRSIIWHRRGEVRWKGRVYRQT